MRFPGHLLHASTFRSEPLMAALAAVAVGMFVGTWVIGPAISYNTPDAPAAQERTTFADMVARPDPMPYRAPTPSFEMSGTPSYAAAAREKARAELGGQIIDPDEAIPERPRYSRLPSRSRLPDRHKVY